MLSGGAVYDHLDFSFTTERPDGSAVPLPAGTPGGGGPELRRQLAVLKDFIESFDFVRMTPRTGADSGDDEVLKFWTVRGGSKAVVRALAAQGKEYALYVKQGTEAEVVLALPAGKYQAEWVSPKTGRAEKTDSFSHAGGNRKFSSPPYSEDIALRVRRTG
jgi:hypothetical protein